MVAQQEPLGRFPPFYPTLPIRFGKASVPSPIRGSALPTREYDGEVNLTIDLDREEDGRWIADALELPG